MTSDAPQPTTVSREVLLKVAASYQELMELRDKQNLTMAQMIRGCVQAITQTTDEAHRRLERAQRNGNPGHFRGNVPSSMDVQRKVTQDRKMALLYLDHLATMLEARPAPEPAPLTGVPATLE